MAIDFGGSARGAIGQKGMRLIARNPEVGANHIRLFLLALGEANQIGHAEFPAGHLREFLGTVDKRTGEIRPATAQTVSNALRTAKRLELLHESSKARCLVLPPYLFQKQGKGTRSCKAHGIRTNSVNPTA